MGLVIALAVGAAILLLPVVSLRVAYGLVTDASLPWGTAFLTSIVAALADGAVGAGLSFLPTGFLFVGLFLHAGVWIAVVSSFCHLDLVKSVLVAGATWIATVVLSVVLALVLAAPMLLAGRPG